MFLSQIRSRPSHNFWALLRGLRTNNLWALLREVGKGAHAPFLVYKSFNLANFGTEIKSEIHQEMSVAGFATGAVSTQF